MWHLRARRTAQLDPEPEHLRRLALLRQAAERAEVILTGAINRGAAQSVPDHELHIAALERATRAAWRAWADEAFEDTCPVRLI